MDGQPWVEKYRPKEFEDIVLNSVNKKIFENIIKKDNFPNLLLYGPPGTGKTTTVINLIDKYQKLKNQKNKGLIIHLNASDDRGVEIVRNQINQFVNTKTLFTNGLKFIILDEVDYMTKNAQIALRYLIQQYSNDIRFCLICNYISRIDEALQNEFIRLKFCNLPKKNIISFLKEIVSAEKLVISEKQLYSIQNMFKSDMRSMINFLQSNNCFLKTTTFNIISEDIWTDLIENYLKKQKSIKTIKIFIENCSIRFNIRKKNFIVSFLNYLIHNKEYVYNDNWLTKCKLIIHHIEDNDNENIMNYFLYVFLDLYKL